MKNVFIFCVVLLSFGCKKYDEGGVSLKSPKSRIKGNWIMKTYEIDGKNGGEITYNSGLYCKSGQYLFCNLDIKLMYDLGIKEDGKMDFIVNSNVEQINDSLTEINCVPVKYKTNNKTVISNCSWSFEDNESKVKLVIRENDPIYPVQVYLFDIIKLSNTEMKLSGMVNSDFTGDKINSNMYLSFTKE